MIALTVFGIVAVILAAVASAVRYFLYRDLLGWAFPESSREEMLRAVAGEGPFRIRKADDSGTPYRPEVWVQKCRLWHAVGTWEAVSLAAYGGSSYRLDRFSPAVARRVLEEYRSGTLPSDLRGFFGEGLSFTGPTKKPFMLRPVARFDRRYEVRLLKDTDETQTKET